MRYLLLRWFFLAIAVSATAWLLPGFTIHQGLQGLIIVSGLLGIVNAVIRPIVLLLTCPLVILTLGLFAIIVNALMLALVAWLLPQFVTLDSFWTTLFASILISVAAAILNALVHDDSRY